MGRVNDFFGALISTIIRFFLTGVAALLPFAVTVVIVSWIVRVADAYIGPSSYFGTLVWKLSGPHSAWAGILAGYFIVILLILLLGFVVSRATAARFHRTVDSMFTKIPFFGKIYAAVGQVVDLLGKKNDSELDKFLGIVQFQAGNVKMLGLLTSATRYVLPDGREHFLIFVPNSPIPATGFNVFIPAEEAKMLDMPVEDLAKVLMSLGILGTQVLRGPVEKLASEKDDSHEQGNA